MNLRDGAPKSYAPKGIVFSCFFFSLIQSTGEKKIKNNESRNNKNVYFILRTNTIAYLQLVR